MWERIAAVLGNSHFEAYIGGPLAGVVAGFIFASIAKPPASGNPAPNVVYIQINPPTSPRRNNPNKSQTHNDTDGSAIIALGLIGIVVVFMFTAFLPQISFVLYSVIAILAAFTFTSMAAALFFGHFRTFAWWSHALFPALASALSFRIAYNVEQSIDPRVIQFAQSLIGNEQLTASLIINGAITFFKQVHPEYLKWMLFQMGATMLNFTVVMAAFFQSIHYIALSHVQASGSPFWINLVKITKRYSGYRTVIVGSILLALAWLMTTGQLQHFFS